MKIDGSAVVVTGGASGLGLEFVRRTATRGARVWVLDRDDEAIAAASGAVAGFSTVRVMRCDVGSEDEVTRAVDEIERQSGGVDALINSAAVLRDQALVSKLGKNIRTHSTADWEETIRCNLTSVFLMSRQIAAGMIRGKRKGVIVNISSISRSGNPGQTAYAATKAAIDALTVTWSQELAIHGIRVVAIAPGFVETRMTRRIPPMFLESLRERTPLKRFGALEEFGAAIEFVLENEYLNGKVLELDGGLRF